MEFVKVNSRTDVNSLGKAFITGLFRGKELWEDLNTSNKSKLVSYSEFRTVAV